MIIVPPLLAIIEGGWNIRCLPLLGLWWSGYFLFYAATLWLKSRMRVRYRRAVLTYGAVTAIWGIATWMMAPFLWRWVPFFLPLIAAAAWAAWQRRDRSVGAGMLTTFAASAMMVVMWDAITRDGWVPPVFVWVHAAFLCGYFAGTVLYVKTNIREKGSRAYLWASWLWHGAWCLAAVGGALGLVFSPMEIGLGWPHAIVWIMLLGRAVAVPVLARRGARIPVTTIGVGEIGASVLVLLTLALA